MAIFARRLLAGQRCTIYGDGEQTRDYVFVADVAEAADLALASSARGVVNISTGRETSVNALHRHIAAALGTVCDPEYAAPRPGEVRRSVLANIRARALLAGHRAIRSSAASAATIEWMRTSRSPKAAGRNRAISGRFSLDGQHLTGQDSLRSGGSGANKIEYSGGYPHPPPW